MLYDMDGNVDFLEFAEPCSYVYLIVSQFIYKKYEN